MKIKRARRLGFLQIRALAALLLFGAAICIAKFSFAPLRVANTEHRRDVDLKRPHYMPVQGERGEELNRMEEEWSNRLTYPTGNFDPAWIRQAVAQDSLVQRAIPEGIPFKSPVGISGVESISPLALSTSGFTALGPAPLRMTGCSGCYDYTKTE